MNDSQKRLIRRIHEAIRQETDALYLVGGAVRDHFLGLNSRDLDLSLNVPLETMPLIRRNLEAAFPHADLRYVRRFGNVKMSLEEGEIDLVPLRRETYSPDSHLPQIESGTFIDDVLRRDFTVNSMYLKFVLGQEDALIDPLGGLKDLRNRVLRLNYPDSFMDDPTRMVRLFVYRHQLDFNIAPETLAALDPSLMVKVPVNDLFGFIQRIMVHPNGQDIMLALADHKLLERIGIASVPVWPEGSSLRQRWELMLDDNPHLIKTFEDLGIYSKLLGKKKGR